MCKLWRLVRTWRRIALWCFLCVVTTPRGGATPVCVTFPRIFTAANNVGYAQIINPSFSNGQKAQCPPLARCAVVTWGYPDSGYNGAKLDVTAPTPNKEVVSIAVNGAAFAALKADGSVSVWGAPATGGGDNGTPTGPPDDVTTAVPGKEVVSLASTRYAFAAIKRDGSVSAWGSPTYGGAGLPVAVTSPAAGKHVESVAATWYAFAALLADGSVSVWGPAASGGATSDSVDGTYTGLPEDVTSPTIGKKVVFLYSTRNAFAALKEDMSVSVWGSTSSGGNGAPAAVTLPNASDGGGVISVASTGSAFAALMADGSVSAWGSPEGGGGGSGFEVPSDVATRNPANKVVFIASTLNAFAALKTDGSVSVWGKKTDGGGDDVPVAVTTPSTVEQKVVSITSAIYSFAALASGGFVNVWGDDANGGDQSDVPTAVSSEAATVGNPVTLITPSGTAFAAWKQDGSLWAWGAYIDDAPDTSSGEHVECAASTWYAFAALKADGSVDVWGAPTRGNRNVPDEVVHPVSGQPVVSITATFYEFAALVIVRPPDARLHIRETTGDNLALRVDDAADDSTYFFVDAKGRTRINSNVFDEADESFVVNGTARFRGDLFLDADQTTVTQQLQEKVSHAELNRLVQSGHVQLHYVYNNWEGIPNWMSADIDLQTPILDGTEIISLTVIDLHEQADPSPLPQVWLKNFVLSSVNGQEVVTGFTVQVVIGADADSLNDGHMYVAEVHWMLLGVPADI